MDIECFSYMIAALGTGFALGLENGRGISYKKVLCSKKSSGKTVRAELGLKAFKKIVFCRFLEDKICTLDGQKCKFLT